MGKGTLIRNMRQISIVFEGELAEIARRLGVTDVRARDLEANIVLTGIQNGTALPPGTILNFDGGAALLVTGYNQPCGHPAKRIMRRFGITEPGFKVKFKSEARGLRGLVAITWREGVVYPGEAVSAHIPERVVVVAEVED